MKLQIKETDIVNSICEYLKIKGYFFWRNNNVAIFSKKAGTFRRFPKWCVKGVPDIFVLTPTKTVAIEVKSETGTQSPDQKLFENLWSSKIANREYYVFRSADEVARIL